MEGVATSAPVQPSSLLRPTQEEKNATDPEQLHVLFQIAVHLPAHQSRRDDSRQAIRSVLGADPEDSKVQSV